MILGRGAPNSGGDGLGTRRPDGGGRWTQPSLPASHVQRASQVLLGFRLGEVPALVHALAFLWPLNVKGPRALLINKVQWQRSPRSRVTVCYSSTLLGAGRLWIRGLWTWQQIHAWTGAALGTDKGPG